jgi:hypothetical protein
MELENINPLNVFEARRFNFLAPHLIPIEVSLTNFYYYEDTVVSWIEHNLKGRYFYGNVTKLVDNRIVTCKAIAFEEQYESTLFLLKCPHIGQN